MPRRKINVMVNPGEPTDGTGRVCVHLFVPDERGPFTEPHALHQATDDHRQPIRGQLVAKPTRGRLACDPRRLVNPVTRGGVTFVTFRTDDARAATCPKCMASADYVEAMARYDQPQQPQPQEVS